MSVPPRCENPHCQKVLPTFWGFPEAYRVTTGQIYCDAWCASDDEQRIFVEAQKKWRHA